MTRTTKKHPTYTISTYDPIDDSMTCGFKWLAYKKRIGKWQLRAALKALYARGYDRDASILVERNYTKAEQKKINRESAARFKKWHKEALEADEQPLLNI